MCSFHLLYITLGIVHNFHITTTHNPIKTNSESHNPFNHLLLQSLLNSVISRLLFQSLGPRSWRSLSLKPTRNPRVLVGKLPEGNSYTSLDIQAGFCDIFIVICLLSELLWGFWELHADIKFGNGNVDFKLIGPDSPDLLHGVWEFSDNQVSLSTNTIDWNALGFEFADELGDGSSLGADTFKVVLFLSVREFL